MLNLNLTQSLAQGTSFVSQQLTNFVGFIRGQRKITATTFDVLRAEYGEIWGAPDAPIETEADYRAQVHRREQAALCLSGGGIRSAAFSLGVLQVLAQRKLLTQFHYLSTVSGGGYIGAWLTRWISEVPDQDARTVENVLRSGKEIRQISSLRANSNFLTPKTGITSADTWTGVMLWVRNVLLNWTVFVPALLFAVLIPLLYLALLAWLADLGRADKAVAAQQIAFTLLAFGGLSLTFATWMVASQMPSHRRAATLSTRRIRWLIVLPVLAWAALVPLILATANFPDKQSFSLFGENRGVLFWVIVTSFCAKVLGYLIAFITARRRDHSIYFFNIVTWVALSAVASGALLLAIEIIVWIARRLPPGTNLLGAAQDGLDSVAPTIFVLCILGPLAVTLAHLLLSTLYVGFRYAGFQDDADREWLARLSAITVFPTLLWAVFAAICLVVPWLFVNIGQIVNFGPTIESAIKWVINISGAIAGVVAVIGGKSPTTKLDIVASAPEKKRALGSEWVVKAATLFFIAFLFAWLAYLERGAVDKLIGVAADARNLDSIAQFWIPRVLVFVALFPALYGIWYLVGAEMKVLVATTIGLAIVSALGSFYGTMTEWVLSDRTPGGKLLVAQFFIAAGLFFVITVASSKIDVNRYSMHGVYRNRLVRAFLGAARAERNEDLFTSFDAADNRRMSELNARVGERRVLFPVINVTLNLVAGQNLAWQERKAASFIISPLYCGSGALGSAVTPSGNDPPAWEGAYIDSSRYGGNEPELNTDSQAIGISLGTAMTISGAAVSSSMGYNSSPATAFLLTMFNVRLGAWLANPAADVSWSVIQDGPTSSLRPLLVEALGMTDARSSNIYLSDGGHFDNLGLYEMIRRRCRLILVIDAGADKEFAFEDLAKAVRQVAIDLDAEVQFDSIEMKAARAAEGASPTFAVGRIRYADTDAVEGCLIYLKPTYFYEKVPVDVRSYGTVNGDFPHESTLDQWFSESQFESYRRLGFYLMDKLYREHVASSEFVSLSELFSAIRKRADRPAAKPASKRKAVDSVRPVAGDEPVKPAAA